MVKVKGLAEQATNAAIIFVCILMGWSYLTKRTLAFTTVQQVQPHRELVGTTLPAVSGYSWEGHPQTLVLALRVGCRYCENSMPFYRKLSELEKENRLHAHLLVVMQEGEQATTTLLKSNDLALDSLPHQDFGSIKVTGTPTLALADAHGRIESAWVGELSPQGERDVVSALEK